MALELEPDPAREIIDHGLTAADLSLKREPEPPPKARLLAAGKLGLTFPAGLEPAPKKLTAEPALDDQLPKADVLVVVWTADEVDALADVLTPGVGRNSWYRYRRGFQALLPQIRSGAPAHFAQRLGSYYLTMIGGRRVLLLKSELHLNQDGVKTGEGTATLPVAELFRRAIAETGVGLVITTGTAGATFADHALGHVVVTRGARFRLAKEFRNEPFAKAAYKAAGEVPTKQLKAAAKLLGVHKERLVEPALGPPTPSYKWKGPLIKAAKPKPKIHLDGVDFPAFHPMLSTDWFEFGTTTNALDAEGCAMEMGDAVLGMVAKEMGASAPRWLVVRNLSDPVIDGRLDPGVQTMWSTWLYKKYGYWTSVNGAIAVWAMIAGDAG